MYEVEGKTAVVTGAASGIGLAMARAFSAAGMSVVLSDIETDRLEKAVVSLKEQGRNVVGIRTDVTDAAQVDALAEAAQDAFGGVHVVANNAGIGTFGALDRLSLDDWKWTLDVNLWGVIHGVRSFLPLLERQGEGHISATSSMAGLAGGAVLGAYHTAKHAVVGLMDSLRVELELASSPVRASVLCPGPIDTDVMNSDRNRPADLERTEPTEQDRRFERTLGESLANGMSSDEVGAIVLDAIRHERFWILTHPGPALAGMAARMDAMRRDNPIRED